MEYLQYLKEEKESDIPVTVLNLIINGIPSIHKYEFEYNNKKYSFKPYYKWNTFNTT